MTVKCKTCIYAEILGSDVICRCWMHPGRVATIKEDGNMVSVTGCEWCTYCYSYIKKE